jgi:hypothetical protein
VARSLKAKRENLLVLKKKVDKTETDLKALQSVGQMIGEMLKQLDEDRFIVKASHGPRYIVGCRKKVRARARVEPCCGRRRPAWVGCRVPRVGRGHLQSHCPPLAPAPRRSTSPSSRRARASRWT